MFKEITEFLEDFIVAAEHIHNILKVLSLLAGLLEQQTQKSSFERSLKHSLAGESLFVRQNDELLEPMRAHE